ncbi:MAG TPA: sodium:proton antiporter [Polyangiaceae bacterium]|jgi:CPA1 family monovalent cation:H+ antiporter|nr:sodium:proton antiporter [Polyangiaceae bacterium]
MADFELLVGLLLVSVVLAGLARRIGVPYPAFLALGGVLLALIPGTPRLEMRPDLALALFVAPVLLDSSYDASPRDLKDDWVALTGLVLVAVGVTTFAVAWVARALVPSMPWAVAVALGAIVAPPDAAAATAVLSQVKPPHRIVTILEGESLLNDASALLIYRVAVGMTLSHGALSFASVAPTFLLAVVGSAGFGILWGAVTLRLTDKVRDVPSSIVLQFVSTFGIWILADRLGLSSVLSMVCFAVFVARRAPERTPARMRVPSYAVWDTVVFVANVLAFILIGLEIRPVLDGLAPALRVHYFVVAGAEVLTVIVVRIAWVMAYNTVDQLRVRWFGFHPRRPTPPPTIRGGVIVSWCGMRGVVTLAAALALPAGVNGGFPYRDLIVLTAFSVVLGTLVVQGLTLKPLLRALDLRDDDPVGREVELARARALRAALTSIEGEASPAADAVRHAYAALLQNSVDGSDAGSDVSVEEEIGRRALAAARHAVSEMRARAEIGDDAFHRLEEDLDRIELSAAS